MADKMDNLIELNKFENINNVRLKKRTNGDVVMNADIVFEYHGKIVNENLDIIIHKTTWEAGQITFEDGLIINSDNLHSQFNPKFQTYICSNEGSLIITDISQKIGKYKVVIIPT
jgi:hypothetical protein